MKIFKKYVSKKDLERENEWLRKLLSTPTQIHTVEKNVEEVRSSFDVPYGEAIPEEVIKSHIASNMVQFLQPLIEYDFSDNKRGGKTYYGSLYVTNKSNESQISREFIWGILMN